MFVQRSCLRSNPPTSVSELQLVSWLKQRGILETTLRQKLVHVVIDAVSGKQTPRWLRTGRCASDLHCSQISSGNGWRSEAMM